jgi:hypothetical protein
MQHKTLAWWDSKNFGDALNPYIFWALGTKVSYAQANTADTLALGSVMERVFKGAHTFKETNFIQEPINIWGSGVHFESGLHIEQPNIELPEVFIRPTKFLAVRGKVSKKRVEDMLGYNLPNNLALGDPGLLMNRIIKGSKNKKYELGIIAHFHDKSSPFIQQIKNKIPNSTIIDVESDPVNFIKRLTQCKAIISTAMHPIIVADSYNIPNLWISTGNKKISSYKWNDYYSVFNISQAPVFNLSKDNFDSNTLVQLKNNYSITSDHIEKIQNDLIKSFPYSNEIKTLTHLDIFKLRLREVKRDYRRSSSIRKLAGLLKLYLRG